MGECILGGHGGGGMQLVMVGTRIVDVRNNLKVPSFCTFSNDMVGVKIDYEVTTLTAGEYGPSLVVEEFSHDSTLYLLEGNIPSVGTVKFSLVFWRCPWDPKPGKMIIPYKATSTDEIDAFKQPYTSTLRDIRVKQTVWGIKF